MQRYIFSTLGIALFSLLQVFGLVGTLKAAEVTLAGRVTNTAGRPVENFTVVVNKVSLQGRDGEFSHNLKGASEIISLDLSAPGYFPVTQVFSDLELKTHKGIHVIPDIQLVARKKGRVMLAFGGDVMMGRRFSRPRGGEAVLIRPDHKAADTKAIVKWVKPYLENADYASVNLETQLMAAKPKGSAPKSVTFFSPPETASALAWAGIDFVTLGNNHTYDNLQEGLVSTLDILQESPLAFAGAGLNEAAALEAHQVDLGGVPYSFLGFVGWKGGSTPHQAAEGNDKGGAALGTMENITRSVTGEVGQGRTTVVQYHGSLEYGEEPTLVTEQRLKSAIDHGADIAIAHHPHVVQGFEIYKDRLLAYSLGNFIFDQYFYGPQFSYMLYVWMDGESFYRAEVVPLQIKGYKPTPAVGRVRQAILKRTATLSERRNVALSYSGGHGVISKVHPPSWAEEERDMAVKMTAGQTKIIPLRWCDSGHFISRVSAANSDASYRFGQEMLRRGDFEVFSHFDAPERGWLGTENQSPVSRNMAYQGRHSFKVSGEKRLDDPVFGMKVFTRLYAPGTPSSFTGQVRATEDVTLKVYFQGRPTRGKLGASLKSAPLKLLGTIPVKKDQWQEIAVNYNSPRVGYRSYRLLVKAEGTKGGPIGDLYFDEVGLIEWRTAFRSASKRDMSVTEKVVREAVPNRYTHVELRAGGKNMDQVTLHEHQMVSSARSLPGSCKIALH